MKAFEIYLLYALVQAFLVVKSLNIKDGYYERIAKDLTLVVVILVAPAITLDLLVKLPNCMIRLIKKHYG